MLGALVIASIDNGLGLLGLSSGTKFVVTGLVLLAAVTVDSFARRAPASGRAERERAPGAALRWGLLSTARIADAVLGAREDHGFRGRGLALAGAGGGLRRARAASRARTAPTRPCWTTPRSTPSTSRCPTACTSSGPMRALRGGQARAVREAAVARGPRRSSEAFDVAEREGRVLAEAFMWRHHPQLARARELRRATARSAALRLVRADVLLPARRPGRRAPARRARRRRR